MPFLGDRRFAANRLDVLALRGDELRQFAAARVGGGSIAMCRVARLFGGDDGFFSFRRGLAQLGDSCLQPLQLFGPRLHLATRQRDFHGETAGHEFRIPLGALSLTRE